MGEHSVQVVISGKGGQQIQLRWQGATSDRPMVLQVASLSTPAPPRLDAGFGGIGGGVESGPGVDVGSGVTVVSPPAGGPAISLELHLRESAPPAAVAPAVVAPAPRHGTAPLATAWATEHLRTRAPSSHPPRAPSSRPPRPRTERSRH